MAKRVKVVRTEVSDAGHVEAVAVSERPEVYEARADERNATQKADFAAAALAAQAKPLTAEQRDILNSREALKHPLDAGQAFFESPSGWIIVAQADRDRVWCQKENGGRGLWINKQR